MGVLKELWERWRVIARKIGDVQARVLLSLFYFSIFGPFAVGVKLLSDPLRLRPSSTSGEVLRGIRAALSRFGYCKVIA